MAYSVVQGDLEPDMLINLAAPGALAALSGALQVQLLWAKPDGTVTRVSLVVVDSTAGILRRTWQAGDTDQIGIHKGMVEVTASNGELATDPNDGSTLVWDVFARL
jgi:hypothetical protein